MSCVFNLKMTVSQVKMTPLHAPLPSWHFRKSPYSFNWNTHLNSLRFVHTGGIKHTHACKIQLSFNCKPLVINLRPNFGSQLMFWETSCHNSLQMNISCCLGIRFPIWLRPDNSNIAVTHSLRSPASISLIRFLWLGYLSSPAPTVSDARLMGLAFKSAGLMRQNPNKGCHSSGGGSLRVA